jgi:GNAT superfamily N-acetyltransferase
MAKVPDEVLEDYYRELMVPAFPPAELITFGDLREGLRHGHLHGLMAFEGNSAVAGLVLEEFVRGRLALLAYLVVTRELRGRGIGQELVHRALSAEQRLVLAEIEDPRFHPTDPETGDPVARARFYRRLGSRLLPIPYMQASLRPGSPRVLDLLLITIPSAIPSPESVDGGLIAEFLDEFFLSCEGESAITQEKDFLALRKAASEAGSLSLVGLDELQLVRPDPG